MTINRKDRVVIIRGQYKGMEGTVASVKAKGRGRGPHAVVFIQKTLRTLTVAINHLRLK